MNNLENQENNLDDIFTLTKDINDMGNPIFIGYTLPVLIVSGIFIVANT